MIPQTYRGSGWRRNQNPKVCFQIKVLPPPHSSESLELKLYLGEDLVSMEESWASEALPFHSLDMLSSSLDSSGSSRPRAALCGKLNQQSRKLTWHYLMVMLSCSTAHFVDLTERCESKQQPFFLFQHSKELVTGRFFGPVVEAY